MSARRYLVVVQDPGGYPAHAELEPAPPEGPAQPVIHTAVLADDFEAMEDRAALLREALAQLVALKDGPRDETYEREKPLAWEQARTALRSTQGDEAA